MVMCVKCLRRRQQRTVTDNCSDASLKRVTMEETKRKRDAEEDADREDREAKKSRDAAAVEEEIGEGVMAWLVTDENDELAADELRKLLEEAKEEPLLMTGNDVGVSGIGIGIEIEDSAPWCRSFRVRFIDEPYATPAVFQSSSGYVTINGNEESCGSSFSDSDASVMASVDARGLFGISGYFSRNSEAVTGVRVEEGRGSWDSSEAEARGWVLDNGGYGILDAAGMDGRDNDILTNLTVFDQ